MGDTGRPHNCIVVIAPIGLSDMVSPPGSIVKAGCASGQAVSGGDLSAPCSGRTALSGGLHRLGKRLQ
jgi:hypothetical protein